MKKLLVVDDDSDIRDSMQVILTEKGFEVKTAKNKVEALKTLENYKPELILMDVMMDSDQEGFEVVQELKNNPSLNHIPVILISGVEAMTCSEAAAEIAAEMRKNTEYKNLNVLILKDYEGRTAIDFISEKTGKSVWLPVKGFHGKPVDYEILMKDIKKLIP